MSLRESILAKDDRKKVKINVPEWGCEVYLYSMTARDFTSLLAMTERSGGVTPEDWYSRIVYLSVCDENGTRIFNESDIPELQDKNAKVIQRIARRAEQLNKMDSSIQEQAEKNSETTPDG